MSDLDWSVLSDTKGHIIIRADTDYGEWMVSTIKPMRHYTNELYREVKIKLRLYHPGGMPFVDVIQRIRELSDEDEDKHADEIDTLQHYTWGREVGSFQSWCEALMMVDMLHEGDAGFPSFNDMMAGMDLNCRYEFDNHRGNIKIFDCGLVRNLELVLIDKEGGFDVNLGARNGHYNLGNIGLHGLESGADRQIRLGLTMMPPKVEDFRRVGLHWMAEMIKQRKARGGLFRKPIIDPDDPYPVGL